MADESYKYSNSQDIEEAPNPNVETEEPPNVNEQIEESPNIKEEIAVPDIEPDTGECVCEDSGFSAEEASNDDSLDVTESDESVEGIENNIEDEESDFQETVEIDKATNDEQACDDREIVDLLSNISGKLEELDSKFDERIRRTENEEKVLDRQHEELQKFKKDFELAYLKMPILTSIIETLESIISITNHYSQKPEGEQLIPLNTFSSFGDDLSFILEDNGFTIYKSEKGDPCEPLKHRVIKKIPTNEEKLHNTIACSKGNGYMHKDKIIQAEKVEIFSYKQN